MALSLLNYLYWDIPEARIPFIIADAVVLYGLQYVRFRMSAEAIKIQEVEAEHAVQEHEMDKAAKQATTVRQRNYNKHNNKKHNKKVNLNNGHVEKHYNIQQPSKRS